MNNYQQIKVKELPVDWFVTDMYYPSGNKKFTSEESTSDDLCDYCIGFNAINTRTKEEINEFNHNEVPCVRNPKTMFGTKHIQLVGANNEIVKNIDTNKFNPFENYDGYIKVSEYDTKFGPDCSGWLNIDKDTYDYAEPIINKGTDYFIYKVSEAK